MLRRPCTAWETTLRAERQPGAWESTFADPVSGEGLIPETQEGPIELKSKKTVAIRKLQLRLGESLVQGLDAGNRRDLEADRRCLWPLLHPQVMEDELSDSHAAFLLIFFFHHLAGIIYV